MVGKGARIGYGLLRALAVTIYELSRSFWTCLWVLVAAILVVGFVAGGVAAIVSALGG